jgi:ferredoxin-NADP reductase
VRATIREKREVARETLLVTFDLGGGELEFSPGQYFFVTLPDRGRDDDRGLRRHFSVVTASAERGVLGLATRLRDSAFKQTLRELPVGTEVEVEEPKGSFVLPEDPSRPLVFVAGGIGITVFRSMLLHIRDEGLPYHVTLVYSNRDRESTAFLDELQELEAELPNLRLVLTMTDDPGWSGEARRLDAAVLRELLGDELAGSTFLVAGPPGMAEAVHAALLEAGADDEHVHVDRFSGY